MMAELKKERVPKLSSISASVQTGARRLQMCQPHGTTVGCTAATCVCRYESMQTTVTEIEAGFNKIAYKCTPYKSKLGQVYSLH